MSEWPMRGHFRYLRFKTFPMTPRTPQCEVFWALLSRSEHSGVPEDSKSSLFPSVGLHPYTWPKQGCDIDTCFVFQLFCLVQNQASHVTLGNHIFEPYSKSQSSCIKNIEKKFHYTKKLIKPYHIQLIDLNMYIF